MKLVALRWPLALIARAKASAAVLGESLSDFVRRAVEDRAKKADRKKKAA